MAFRVIVEIAVMTEMAYVRGEMVNNRADGYIDQCARTCSNRVLVVMGVKVEAPPGQSSLLGIEAKTRRSSFFVRLKAAVCCFPWSEKHQRSGPMSKSHGVLGTLAGLRATVST